MGSLQGVTRLEKLTSNLAPLRTLTISGKLKPVSHLLCRRYLLMYGASGLTPYVLGPMHLILCIGGASDFVCIWEA